MLVYGQLLWTKTQSVKVNECRSASAPVRAEISSTTSARRNPARDRWLSANYHCPADKTNAISLSASHQFLCLARDGRTCWLPDGLPPPPILFRASIEHKTTRIGQGARRPMESLVVLDLLDWTPPTLAWFDWA